MTGRINEDIRYYLPADPYYYKVDNLPLEDLLSNDTVLQEQIDELRSTDISNAIQRNAFLDLAPFIDVSIPGTVTVRPGSFIGRTNRTNDLAAPDGLNKRTNDGIREIGDPPTVGGGPSPGDYNIDLPGFSNTSKYVGRTSVFQFLGGNITIDGFDYNEWGETVNAISPPQGRLDLIGITTAAGAFDGADIAGNNPGSNLTSTDGLPQLAVVKGAGITYNPTTQERVVVAGKKFATLGTAAENINQFGHDLDGNVVPNPNVGTIPGPDDVVNSCFARQDVTDLLEDWAFSNRNSDFFLPLGYVYVPQTHIAGNPLPERFLKDIRPFFRTAELTLNERQALAAADTPSLTNPVVTGNQQNKRFTSEINRRPSEGTIQSQIDTLNATVNAFATTIPRTVWNALTINSGSINGTTSNPTRKDITAGIRTEHRGLNITKLYIAWYPVGATGDINTSRMGMMNGDGGARSLYAISYGADARHTSSFFAPSNSIIYPPITVGNNYYVDLFRSGQSQGYYVVLYGYEYLQDITI